MKKYYQLTDDYELDYGITKSPRMPDGVLTGESIDANSLPPLNFEINVPDDESCTHYMTEETVVVSDVFVKLLQKIGVDNFQAFPVKLKNPKTKKQREGYFLFNVLGMVRAADLSKSSYDMLMDGDEQIPPLVAFNEITLDAKKIPDLHMFLLAESPSTLIIDDYIHDALLNNRPEAGWGIMLEEVDLA